MIVVTGFRSRGVEEARGGARGAARAPAPPVFNDRAEEWNNAYSLWLARHAFRRDLLVNGDTVHPRSVERPCSRRALGVLVLAVDS